MQSIFNYNTLCAKLEKKTRTLFIKLDSDRKNHINMEMLFELESLLAWVSNKVEIHSILFKSQEGSFSAGHNPSTLKNQTQQQIQKMTQKLQTIVQAMIHLPQTIVVDLGLGANNIGAELSVGADLRISNKNCQVAFDHSNIGLVPSSCGMSAFSILIGHTHAKNFLLSGRALSNEQLLRTGFVIETYSDNREEVTTDLLKSIHAQAPVQRIQTKLGIFENIRESFEHAMKIEKQVSKAALMTEDWKNIKTDQSESKENKNNFMPSKSMSYSVKLSLVKDDHGTIN